MKLCHHVGVTMINITAIIITSSLSQLST